MKWNQLTAGKKVAGLESVTEELRETAKCSFLKTYPKIKKVVQMTSCLRMQKLKTFMKKRKISDFKETAHPCLSLNVPVVVSCRGGCLTGKVQCEDMKQIEVYFEVLEEHLKSLIMPNPAIPDKDGNYAADITPKHGMTESITIRAFIFWKGKRIVSHPGCTILACSSKKMDDD